MHSPLIQKLEEVGVLASGSVFRRIFNNPINYLMAIGHREFIYTIFKKPLYRSVKLFWGGRIKIALPSGIDMCILGAKADDSEIRLSKYLIRNLKAGNSFIDIGAHFGYYSKLAAYLVEGNGNVISVEPSKLAFELLKENTTIDSNTTIHNSLVGSGAEEVPFYEFPTKYAEYNSIDIEQYKSASWFDKKIVTKTQRQTRSLDDLIKGSNYEIDFIKLDVEGAEYEVLLGARKLFQSFAPTISLEYVNGNRTNKAHKSAVDLLRGLGYQSYRILQSGDLEIEEDLDQSLADRHLESDNFIFSQKY